MPLVLRTAFFIMLATLALTTAGPLPASAETRRVVLLFDERVELPGLSSLDAEFAHTLQANSADPVEIYRESLDFSRFDSDAYKSALRDFLRAKYSDRKIDVAVAVMAPSFDFLAKYGGVIFPGTPIVFSGLDRRQIKSRPLPPNWYGVLVKREFAPTLDVVLRIHPRTRELVVVSGTSEFDTILLAQAQNEFRSYESRVAFTYLSDLPFASLLPTLSNLPSDNVVLFTTLFQDGAGKPFVPHEAIERISAAANVPVYGFLDQYLGRGILGGSLYSFVAHGEDTAKLVLRILSGDAPSEAFSEGSDTKMMFDWRQMQRWSVSESRLPAGSEIYFREPSTWEKYRWQVSLVSSVLVLQTLLIAGLLYQIRRRRLAEVEAVQRAAELAHINRFAVSGQLTTAIAHELNQPLGAILANSETMEIILKSPTPDLKEIQEIVGDIKKDDLRASDVIRHLRSLLKKTPFEAKEIDLNVIVLETMRLLAGLASARGITFTSAFAAAALPIEGDRVQLQQVLINLIVNAVDAVSTIDQERRVVSIQTSSIGHMAEVAVSDKGAGIASDKLERLFEPFFTTKESGMGMGLSIARTIIQAHHGKIFAENSPKGGAVFRVRLPVRENQP